jgi:phosphate binding protein
MTKGVWLRRYLVLSVVLSLLLAACGGPATTPAAGGAGTESSPVGQEGGTTPPAGESSPASVGAAGSTPAEETTPVTEESPISTPPVSAAQSPVAEGTPPERGADGAGTAGPPPNAQQLGQLRGNVTSDGSSTVQPVTQAAAEEFSKYARNVRVSVGTSGTGGGFEKFCRGETDISNASRPIEEDEIKACQEKGIEFIEVPVAVDGLTVVANPENTWAQCLTTAELKKIWDKPAEGKVTNWSQVRQGFPEEELALFGPGTDSGTFDYFTEAINGEEGRSRADYEASEDDNVIVRGVEGSGAGAVGYFGFAYFQAEAERLKAIQVDGGEGCVSPTFETIRSGQYAPLSRPLFIYVRADSAKRPEVKEFVKFMLNESFYPTIESPQVGYVALTPQQYQGISRRFEAGTTGTLQNKEGTKIDDYTK